MRSRDASKSDLLVAVTAMDEVNIIACMLAKKNGIPHTIARIRDPKFLSEPVDYIKENFDIDLVLSPELITAREISRLVMTPSAINVEDFAKGRVRLLEMKLSPRSPFAHKELKDITLPPSVLIALILRDHHMIIPHGSDRLLPLDNVYFLGNPESLAEISSHGHAKYQRRTKKALIIGAGRTGQALAPMLEKQGISVKVIDNNEDHCQQMVERLKKGMVLCGDGTDMDMLTQEGGIGGGHGYLHHQGRKAEPHDGPSGKTSGRRTDHGAGDPHGIHRPHAAGGHRHRPVHPPSRGR